MRSRCACAIGLLSLLGCSSLAAVDATHASAANSYCWGLESSARGRSAGQVFAAFEAHALYTLPCRIYRAQERALRRAAALYELSASCPPFIAVTRWIEVAAPSFLPFTTRRGHEGWIAYVSSLEDLMGQEAQNLLISSFIGEYQPYLLPEEIYQGLSCWWEEEGPGSVESYYKRLFQVETDLFRQGKVWWVQAFVEDRLVGWVDFEPNPQGLLMRMLVVDPRCQREGIGQSLVWGLHYMRRVSQSSSISLWLRKKNRGGHSFYSKLGFHPEVLQGGEEDALLEPWRWTSPTEQESEF